MNEIGIEITAILIAVAGCLIAAFKDLKTGLIPNKIPFTMIALSVPLALAMSYFAGISFFILWIINFIGAFIFAYALWQMRAWAGGDAKMFWAVIALIPVHPAITAVAPRLLPPYLDLTFIITFFLNLGILLLTKFWVSALLKSVHEKETFKFTRMAVTPFLFVLSSVSFAAGLSSISGVWFLVYASIPLILLLSYTDRYGFYAPGLSIILLLLGLFMCGISSAGSFILFMESNISILFFVFLITAYVVGSKSERVLDVDIDRLKEGMPLAEKVCLENRVIAAPAPAGLSKEDIMRLKKYRDGLNNTVRVYVGVRLMPFMLLALLISLFAGDVMWLFLHPA